MKIVGISASPRRGGNTEIFLDTLLEAASSGADTEKLILNELKFVPCQECEDMAAEGDCRIKDGMHSVYDRIRPADVIVLASPIFFGSLSAQAKMMIDRFQCVWRLRYMLNKETGYKEKKGIFLCVEASTRRDFFENARGIVKNFFATINATYSAELLCSGVDEKASILSHEGCLKEARVLGSSITAGG